MKRLLYVAAWLLVVLVGYVGWRDGWLVGGSRPSPAPFVNGAASPSPVLSPVPSPSPSPEILISPSPVPSPVPSPLSSPVVQASKIQLSVPFTIQAPDSQWVEPWKEGCEEAALLMVDAYLRGSREERLPVAETKQKIAEMVQWQHQRFGGHYDLGLSDIAIIAREYMGYSKVRVETGASFEALRKELAAGHPVILPAAGQRLKNPHFVQPGPPYHVFVLTGYDGADFIANENGTRQGRGYRYAAATLEDAWYDYDSKEKSATGPRAYLVLER